MNSDWMPFFRAMFWFATKLAGLVCLIYPLVIALPFLFAGGGFFTWIGTSAVLLGVPAAIGVWLLRTDTLYGWATAEPPEPRESRRR